MESSWNRDAPPGFQRFDPELPFTIYRRQMPHWRQDGATYFVTFRLIDSIPQSKLNELKAIRREWESNVSNQVKLQRMDGLRIRPAIRDDLESLASKIMTRVEKWLDEGIGDCSLRDPHIRQVVVRTLHHFDGQRYELGCFVVMPNHVHVVVRPLLPGRWRLEHILQSWKRHSSREIGKRQCITGSLWQKESFDRIVRDEEHLLNCIRYTGRNPSIAQLSPSECSLWIRPQWEEVGWQLEEDTA